MDIKQDRQNMPVDGSRGSENRLQATFTDPGNTGRCQCILQGRASQAFAVSALIGMFESISKNITRIRKGKLEDTQKTLLSVLIERYACDWIPNDDDDIWNTY